MRNLLYLLSAFLALPLMASAQSVTLPAEIKGGVGAWVIVAPEKVDGGAPKWRLDPGLQEVRLDLLLPPEVLGKLKGKVVTAQAPGRYKIESWNAKGDVASEIAICWVVIQGSGPEPPKPPPPEPVPPDPMPVPKTDALSIVAVWESADSTPAVAAVMKNLAFWKSLEPLNVKWFQFDQNQKIVKDNGYMAHAPASGVPFLLYMAKDGKVLRSEALPDSTAKIRQTVKELTGK